MGKKKAVKKKGAKGSTSTSAPSVAAPEQVPMPGSLQTYVAVPDETLAQHMKQISLDQVRKYLLEKVQLLQSYQQDCPGALFSDVENVIVHLQVATTGVIVQTYVKLMETMRFWRAFCSEKETVVEQTRKLYQRNLMGTVRSSWDVDPKKDGKMTVDAVDAKVRSDQGHDNWLAIQRHWEHLGNQLQQIILSMQTEMLVQASMWERAQDIGQNVPPHGAVTGQ